MPPSQLKRLRASLREEGIIGPTPKKRKKSAKSTSDDRTARNNRLAAVREKFNAFGDASQNRRQKFPVLSIHSANGETARQKVSASEREELRRNTLSLEREQRHKVGGIIDRRIGEYNPHLTQEERMLERFTKVKKKKRTASLFNLEDDDAEDLTHMGVPLTAGSDLDPLRDDYEAGSVQPSSEEEPEESSKPSMNRIRAEDIPEPDPNRQLSRAEVLKEVVAKSKIYKYERQQAKEEDRELCEALDGTSRETIEAMLGFNSSQPLRNDSKSEPNTRSNGVSTKNQIRTDDKAYDAQVKQLALEQRAKPADRVRTDEEKAAEHAAHMKALEEQRFRRMRGEVEAEDEQDIEVNGDMDEPPDDAAAFGLQYAQAHVNGLEVEDEDDFLIEEGLVADWTGLELDSDIEGGSSDSDNDEEHLVDDDNDDGNDELIEGLFSKEERENAATEQKQLDSLNKEEKREWAGELPCPRNHDELLRVFDTTAVSNYPRLVQRIRALYQLQLHESNKDKLADFASALVHHLFYMANRNIDPSLIVIETLIRHIHSMSRKLAEPIARAFRAQLQGLHQSSVLTSGHCVILAAIGSIYPPSDHFHQVVSPAITLMAKWLEMTRPRTSRDRAFGAYISALCLNYHSLSRRYMPEMLRFTVLALKCSDATAAELDAQLTNLEGMLDLWSTKSAFTEIFTPAVSSLLNNPPPNFAAVPPHRIQTLSTRLSVLLSNARRTRRPLELHHHKPIPIKTSIPKFEPLFNPSKHYDPDRERAESTRLRKEHRRERKSLVRDVRRDAQTRAREWLKEKKEKDRAYEEKYRKLVAEIQGEEGREKNEYEREKKARKSRGR